MSDLPDSEPLLRALFGRGLSAAVLGDALPAGVFLADTTGGCVYTNSRLRAICGLTEEQALGHGWTLALHPDDREGVWQDWRGAMARDEEWEADFRVRHGDQSVRWVAAHTRPLRDDQGVVIGHLGTVEDVSRRKATEEAAARADARQQLLQSKLAALVAASGTLLQSPTIGAVLPATMALAKDLLAADGYAVWRLVDHIEWRVEAAAGVSEDFVNESIPTTAPYARQSVDFPGPLFVKDVRTSDLLRGRHEALAREGVASLLIVPLVIQGSPSGTLVLYYRDPREEDPVDMQTAAALGNLAAAAIAAAEHFERELHHRERADRSRQRAAFLADASTTLASSLDWEVTLRSVAHLAVPDVADWCSVDILDADRGISRLAIAHVNPAKIDLARSYRERFPSAAISRIVDLVVETGGPILISPIREQDYERAAQSPEHLAALRELGPRSLMAAPLATNGRVRGVITFITAESERLYDQDDVQFAQAVAARAALAIDNAAAYAEVRAANRTKDEFLATLSHELRTPINAIMGWAQMLQRGIVEPSRMQHAVEAIVRNAAAQGRLVEDLLDVSRIITGKFRLDVDTVDLATVLSSAVATVEPTAQAKGVRLEVTCPESSTPVYGDRHRLQQVVWNLLANAVKFTPRGGRIEVRAEAAASEAEITVADTGDGIPAEALPFIFDRFRQADSSSTRQHTGMGLGLAIVRHIVELHGGRVTAESDGEDRGSVFRIRLPLRSGRAAAEGSAPTVTAESLVVPPLPDLAETTVLLVEDDDDARQMVAYLLRQRQAAVMTARSAAEALEQFETQRPDVLISDVEMPDRDGLSLIAEIRSRSPERGGTTPAAALTAHSSPEDRARALLAGFDAHLTKPVDLSDLISTVVRLKAQGAIHS